MGLTKVWLLVNPWCSGRRLNFDEAVARRSSRVNCMSCMRKRRSNSDREWRFLIDEGISSCREALGEVDPFILHGLRRLSASMTKQKRVLNGRIGWGCQ